MIREPYIARQRADHGRRAVAVLPIHYPKELLTALDLLAVEVWGPPGPPRGDAAGRIQTYVCAVVRNALAFLASGGADVVDAALFPHTCDSIQQLATLAADFGGWQKPALTFLHPKGPIRPSTRRFLLAELRALAAKLEVVAGRPLEPARLAAAIRLHREIDAHRAALLDARAALPVDDRELYGLLRRGEWLWPEDHLAELRAARARLGTGAPRAALPVLVTGYVPEPIAWLDVLNGAGALVAADDYAAVGRRVVREPDGPIGDPWEALLDRYAAAPPCPTRSSDQAARMRHLEALLDRSGARGVVVHVVKFCEPELFDVPAIRRTCAARDVPLLILEGELERQLSGQAVTRIEGVRGAARRAGAGPDFHRPAWRGWREDMILRRAQYELASRVVGPFLAALDDWQRRRRKRPRRDGPFGPPLESLRALKDLMTVHYFGGRYADGAVPVAWVTSGFPVELLRPLGFHTVYPENHGAMCGVQRIVPALSDAVEAQGYSRDLCSYVRSDLGSLETGRSPAGRLPRPDLLACCTNICQTVLYWYRDLARRFGVPLVLVDTPFVYGEATDHQLRYVVEQLEEAIAVAERIAGRPLDRGALRETARLARDGSQLWGECLETARARPAPWTGVDGFFHLGPIVAMRGTKACNAYYRLLLDELRDRVARGVGGLRGEERHRLVWDNLPVWYATREITTQLATGGFNFVCTTYTNAWAEAASLIDPDDPVASSARCYSQVLLNRDLPNKLRVITRLARDFGADGAVLHSDRSCKPYSIGQVDLKDRLARDLGIRTLLLEADHNDPRAWASELATNRLAAFMESFA